jgi:hypothetical protein
VAATIGAAFDLSDSGERSLAERLPTVMRNMPFLVVLDNLEHVVDAAAVQPADPKLEDTWHNY